MTSPFNEGQAHGAGFTLVEMLVVLAILSMVLAVSLPLAIRGGKGGALQADARIVAAKLRQARETALMTRRPTTVLINLTPAGVADAGGSILALQAARRVTVVTAKGVSEDRRAAIVFEPNGSSTGGDIQLSGDGHSTRVQVDWLTGAIIISGSR
ncbi:GspH/FimT family pseudopilin [Aestuariivirga sp.]|uniref:GspH/FimT family pseudopilin n=1 Tax=Aestuariivirga sp. TaxID=2650926 RepID=UPI003BABFF5B